ncbi:hypothetical protein LOK49_LG11G02691 [Camellia lanceoleosa]|uniref:Uncharacterized protein n=1 Tax=Camellia lanceoleosa TaxID=1840588 RepID=A0ACC0G5S9_9ERIC|nr:hypothetical protein LOK49_LG11G02691 [Camellia lanceoleosa]
MPATDNQGSFLNRISIRRNQVVSMDVNHEQELEDLELFQKHVVDRFSDLLTPQPPPPTAADSSPDSALMPADTLLSIAWFRKLLDAFLCCEAEFKAVLIMGRDPTQFAKPPLDRLIPELLDRTVKALDVCNAITHGVELVCHWQKLAQIGVKALEQRPIGEGHVRRAKKALNTLLTSMTFDDKENNSHGGKSTERSWSFGRRGGGASVNKDRTAGTFRSLSWSVAKSWSASKQIQAMSSNLVAPRGGEPTGEDWACDPFSGPEAVGLGPSHDWATGEDWGGVEEEGEEGDLWVVGGDSEDGESVTIFGRFRGQFSVPAEAEKVEEVAAQVTELAEICQKMDELVPLQQQVREVFHRIVRSRAEVLDVLDQVGKMSTPVLY